jgi:DNA-binding PadR family transcriptional regulator
MILDDKPSALLTSLLRHRSFYVLTDRKTSIRGRDVRDVALKARLTSTMGVSSVSSVRRRQEAQAPMRSLVNWALLGLIIDRPSYAYELAQRFEREYQDALSLSSVSHVYTALGTLRERELVEEVAGTRSGRQPKPHYRATPKGLTEYREWLLSQIGEDLQRQRLFVLQLGALTRNPDAALEIVDSYERSCLELARELPISSAHGVSADEAEGAGALTARLIAEESRLSIGAKLAWAQFARRHFAALAEARAARR